MYKYINLHTHKLNYENSISIYNTFLYKSELINGFQSVGLHPWHLNRLNIEIELQKIEDNLLNNNILAVGECGLDKICDVDFDFQISIFKKIIEVAEKYSKPLIIHSVKSDNEILNIRKSTNLNLPWVIHGFSGNMDTAKKLNDKNIYFSIGKSIFNRKSKIHNSIKNINPNFYFLETDNDDFKISEIYSFLSEILNISEKELHLKMIKNFKEFFNITI